MNLRIKVFLLFTFGIQYFVKASVLEGGWDLSGQVVMESRVYQKPSSLSGTSAFQIPWLTLDARFVSRDGGELFLEVLGISPAPAGTSEFQLRQASFFLPEVLGESVDLRAGLLASELSQRMKAYWPIHRLSNELDFSLQRWNYQAFSDYGFEVFGFFGSFGSWGFQATNGEGRGTAEKGPQKDLQVWIAAEWGEERTYLVYLQGRRGAYENIPAAQASKERVLLGFWSQMPEGWSAGLDMFATWDPVDAINGLVAESIDLTDLGGKRVHGRGASLAFRYAVFDGHEKLWQVFFKSDWLKPVFADSARDVRSHNFGLLYSPRVNVQWALYNSQTATEPGHNLNNKEQQSWRLALNVDLND